MLLGPTYLECPATVPYIIYLEPLTHTYDQLDPTKLKIATHKGREGTTGYLGRVTLPVTASLSAGIFHHSMVLGRQPVSHTRHTTCTTNHLQKAPFQINPTKLIKYIRIKTTQIVMSVVYFSGILSVCDCNLSPSRCHNLICRVY
jgi:hypothetical protein